MEISQKSKLKLSSFVIGNVYLMNVGKRSHVKKPYYVVIKDVGMDYIETYIPNSHSLIIKVNSPEWEYLIPRMQYIGNKESDIALVHGQKHLVPSAKGNNFNEDFALTFCINCYKHCFVLRNSSTTIDFLQKISTAVYVYKFKDLMEKNFSLPEVICKTCEKILIANHTIDKDGKVNFFTGKKSD